MQKIVNKLITSSIKGVDVYRWKNATWLIFTDETRWVVELTDEGTLWYNHSFFNDVFKYVSMKCGKESEDHITQWANDYFYKGIEKTEERGKNNGNEFEWHTRAVIGKGVKEVNDSSSIHRKMRAENLVGRIIRDVKPNLVDVLFEEQKRCYYDPTCHANNIMITNIIEEGIKNTYPDMIPGDYNWQDEFDADKVIEYGVKLK